jgi:hypothetical protein
MICYIHACEQPCEECAFSHFLYHAFGPAPRVGAPSVIVFKPGTFDHIYDPWEKPRVIDTPQELRRECAARGVEVGALRDSLLWPSRAPREW